MLVTNKEKVNLFGLINLNIKEISMKIGFKDMDK
jgi:hypothetical protein